jgi:hypothetical protein
VGQDLKAPHPQVKDNPFPRTNFQEVPDFR